MIIHPDRKSLLLKPFVELIPHVEMERQRVCMLGTKWGKEWLGHYAWRLGEMLFRLTSALNSSTQSFRCQVHLHSAPAVQHYHLNLSYVHLRALIRYCIVCMVNSIWFHSAHLLCHHLKALTCDQSANSKACPPPMKIQLANLFRVMSLDLVPLMNILRIWLLEKQDISYHFPQRVFLNYNPTGLGQYDSKMLHAAWTYTQLRSLAKAKSS